MARRMYTLKGRNSFKRWMNIYQRYLFILRDLDASGKVTLELNKASSRKNAR